MIWAYPPGNLHMNISIWHIESHWTQIRLPICSHQPLLGWGNRRIPVGRGRWCFFEQRDFRPEVEQNKLFPLRSLQQDLSYLVYLNWLQFSNMCPISINILTILPLDLVDIHVWWVQKTKPWWCDIRQAFQVNCLAPGEKSGWKSHRGWDGTILYNYTIDYRTILYHPFSSGG